MPDSDALAARFETHRPHLRAVAYRMLGSLGEAEDAVQEAWLHLARHGGEGIDNLGGWLTTTTARVCLDWLRSRQSRREQPTDDAAVAAPDAVRASDPEQEALLAESVGLAALVVLDRLSPAERIAFVLHDLFALSFDEIAPLVGRSEETTRQLASRARRRVQGVDLAHEASLDVVASRQREVAGAFLAAVRAGDLDALVAVLAPDVVFRTEVSPGVRTESRGARTWARQAIAFSRTTRWLAVALLDGVPGALLAPGGKLTTALRFTFVGDVITEIDVVSDPAELARLDVAVLGPTRPCARRPRDAAHLACSISSTTANLTAAMPHGPWRTPEREGDHGREEEGGRCREEGQR